LREYLQSTEQTWREDSSNASTHFTRNHLRLEAIPLLAKIANRAPENLACQWTRASALWRDDVEYLEQQARATLQNLIVAQRDDFLAIDGPGYLALPIAMQRRVLREAARNVYGSFYAANAEQVEIVRRQVAANGRRMVWQWQGGVRVEWTGEMAGNRIRVWHKRSHRKE
jgi:tRNA(Ile)-lysidine synthase